MLGGLSRRMPGGACALAAAATLTATLVAPLVTPTAAVASTTPAPSPASTPSPSSTVSDPLGQGGAVPSPVYPTATDGPSQQREPHVAPEDEDTLSPGNFMAADGRIVPGIGWLTESLDQAVLWKLRPRVDQQRLIHVARGLPLDGRKVMLTVDEAEPGTTPQQVRQDAEATADAMVTEYREGMPLEHWTPGSETRPRLDPGWVMLTVMVPPSEPGPDAAEPVVVLELGQGVTLAAEDSAALIEGAGREALGEGDLTDGLEELVRTAVAQTGPPPDGAGVSWTSLTQGRAVLWAVLVAGLAAVAVVPRVLASRRRRREVGAHTAQPGWYPDPDGDPALRLRRIVEALGLALDAPGARGLPSADPALAALVEHTLELDRVAPRSRQGRAAPGRRAGRGVLQARVQDAEQLLARLVAEGDDARRRVRFPPDVRQVVAEGSAQTAGAQTAGAQTARAETAGRAAR